MNPISSVSNGLALRKATFDPENILTIDENKLSYAILILNRPVDHPVDFIIPFWNKAAFRITVDGGTNRWFSYLQKNKISSEDLSRIDIVSGDFDSIHEDSLKIAENQNSKSSIFQIIHTPDQNETDFTKALRLLTEHCSVKNIVLDAVFVLCQTSGRLDQIMANINTMHKCMACDLVNRVPVYLLSDDSLSWLLEQGESTIKIPNLLLKSNKSWCALIPFSGNCDSITTSGLKWNLKGARLEFGKLVSTSNSFDGSSSVCIDTSDIILWSMNIIPLFCTLYGLSEEEYS